MILKGRFETWSMRLFQGEWKGWFFVAIIFFNYIDIIFFTFFRFFPLNLSAMMSQQNMSVPRWVLYTWTEPQKKKKHTHNTEKKKIFFGGLDCLQEALLRRDNNTRVFVNIFTTLGRMGSAGQLLVRNGLMRHRGAMALFGSLSHFSAFALQPALSLFLPLRGMSSTQAQNGGEGSWISNRRQSWWL